MPVTTGTTTGTSSGGGSSSGQGGQNNGLTTGYVGAAGTNNGAWSGDGVNLGLTTGPKIYGNTAYGPAGGSAIAHATMSPASMAGMGMGPTNETYSNFMTPSGQSMYSNIGSQSFTAPNFSTAMSMANAANQMMSSQPPSRAGSAAPPPVVAPPPTPKLRAQQVVQGWLPSWPGTGQWWGNMPRGSYPAARSAVTKSDFAGSAPYSNSSTVSMNNQGNTAGYGPGSSFQSGSGWGPGGNPEGGYGSGGASFGY